MLEPEHWHPSISFYTHAHVHVPTHTDPHKHIQNIVYTKHRACAQMLLICVIMECPTLMEEESMPLRKSGLLKCHSRFRELSFKREDFSPSSSSCLFAPLSVYVLSSCTPVFIVHPLSLSPSWSSEECHNVLFDSGTGNREQSCTVAVKGAVLHLNRLFRFSECMWTDCTIEYSL